MLGMALGGGLLGGLTGRASKPDRLSLDKIRGLMGNTQGLVDEQVGLSRQLMDPSSAVNMQMRNMLAQRSNESGALAGGQMMRLGAMRNMSPAQTMMQGRMASNQAMGAANNQWLQSLMQRFGQGQGLMRQMGQQQQGLDENIANAYVANTNMMNQYKANYAESIQKGILGGLDFAGGSRGKI
jgi:hypothetical protein